MIDISMARARIMLRMPYFSTAIMSLRPVQKPGLGTFACDKYWNLYYDPALEWNLDSTVGALIHELQHLLRLHHERQVDPDPDTANIAEDAEINDDLLDDGLTLPSNPVPQKLRN